MHPGPQRRVAIVSGAGRGIGAAIAKALAAADCDVVVHYQANQSAAQATARECEAAGAKAVLVAGPIEEEATAIALVETAIDRFGRLDIVVNNAGITTSGKALHENSADEIMLQFRVHCLGAFMLTPIAKLPRRSDEGLRTHARRPTVTSPMPFTRNSPRGL